MLLLTVRTKTPNSLAHAKWITHVKLCLHYGDFVQANFNMADKTADQLQSMLRVNKASAKAFEPRTTWSYIVF